VSTVKEIQEAVPNLSREVVEAVRDWIEDYLEERLELSDEARAKLDQSRREITAGRYTTRQPRLGRDRRAPDLVADFFTSI
jgi:hypothetical protein